MEQLKRSSMTLDIHILEALLSSLPQLGVKGEPLYSIREHRLTFFNEIEGDAFAPRKSSRVENRFRKKAASFLPRIGRHILLKHGYWIHGHQKWNPACRTSHAKQVQGVCDMKDENKEVLIEFDNVRVQFKRKREETFRGSEDVSFQIYKEKPLGWLEKQAQARQL